MHETVQLIARDRPEAVALVRGRATMTYAELDHDADVWAARLAAAGVGAGDIVPILLPKHFGLITALLAVLKTGAAYALLDPGWPPPRLGDVIDLLAAPLLVTEPGMWDAAPLPVWTAPKGPTDADGGFAPVRVDGSDPCCVFFTSGTTGRPKGVLTPHRATARLFRPGGFARFDATTAIPLATAVPWDAFSLELWAALLNGGASVLIDEPYLSAESLRSVRRPDAPAPVNTVWLTSSLFNMVVDEDIDAFAGLRQVLTGGERLSPAHAARFLDRHPEVPLINGYGPVESTVFATTHRITPADCDRMDGIPLGRPVAGTSVAVFEGARRCGPGEVGEICIAGEGLASRYLGAPRQTAIRFPNLPVDGVSRRFYRTGDLGTLDEDAVLHFRGRADRQVKIRGHRIEPAGVERQVEELLPAVRTCRVLAVRDENGAAVDLVAFCVPARRGDPLTDALRALRESLVSYQRPSRVVSVAEFPLTPQGKLDERALLALLPAPGRQPTTAATATDRVAQLVADTFGDVLGRHGVPVDVSFFELGGGSLDAGRVCARLSGRLGRPVPISLLYRAATAEGLADQLRSAGPPSTEDDGGRHRSPHADAVPLTAMQVVFATRQVLDPADRTGHCLLAWTIHGELDQTALRAAIGAVHGRHESLRSAYLIDPHPAALPLDLPAPPLEVLPDEPSVREALAALRFELSDHLDIGAGEVWRTALVCVPTDSANVFGCVIHHIAFDGWSESVLADDLTAAYDAARGFGRPELPAPPSLAAAYEDYQRNLAHADYGATLDRVVAGLSGVPQLRWPDAPDPVNDARIGHLTLDLPAEALLRVDALASELSVTRFVVLLSCWARVLAEVTGQRDFAVGVPVAQRGGPGLDRSIGCHINMLAVRMRTDALEPGSAGVAATGRVVRSAFAAQDVPFADVLQRVQRPHVGGRPLLFQTLFAVQDNASPRLPLSGLRTEFLRQPYLDLPLELHAELWPGDPTADSGAMLLVVSYQTSAVSETVARRCAGAFVEALLGCVEGVRS